MWYPFVQALVRVGSRALGRLEVIGLENVPDEGPFILIANHQSYVDPILIQAVVRRPVHTMAKSTQFSNRFVGAFMTSLKSFPVRRFEIDPQAVRLALRALDRGEGAGIYIEGERSWDGRLQPPRLGSVRLLLKAGAPVVPCGISGAYDLWPRWASRPRRGTITIRFGEPLRFPTLHSKAEREAWVDRAADQVMDALAELARTERAG